MNGKPNERWLEKKVPLSLKEAQAIRQGEIECLLSQIQNLECELKELREIPLATYTTTYDPVFPGDPDYEKAEDLFDPLKFKGSWSFKTNL